MARTKTAPPPVVASNSEEIVNRLYRRIGDPWAQRLQAALEVNYSTVWRWTENGFPAYVVALVEFLEKTPKAHWPERWLR